MSNEQEGGQEAGQVESVVKRAVREVTQLVAKADTRDGCLQAEAAMQELAALATDEAQPVTLDDLEPLDVTGLRTALLGVCMLFKRAMFSQLAAAGKQRGRKAVSG